MEGDVSMAYDISYRLAERVYKKGKALEKRRMKTKKTLKETVVEGIYREIEEGIYKPNDIIHEGEIMEKYAMSKSPVREALIELCKDNVLKSIPRVGYQVVPVTLKEILDLLEFRIDVETGNLEAAVPENYPVSR